MNSSQALKKIKVLLGMETKLMENKLKDGTMVVYDNLEVGSPIFVVTEDGTQVPAPVGTHVLEDGTQIIVDVEGTIGSIAPVEAEPEKPEGSEMAEPPIPEAEIEKPEETTETTPTVEEEIASLKQVIEDQQKRLVEIEAVIAELVTGFGSFTGDVKKLHEKVTEIATAPSSTPVFASKTEVPVEEPQNTRFINIDEIRKIR